MIELEQLNQLVTIADSQTISAAAEKLHLSQPALSRAMQRLERELGVELFHRKKNRLGLNPTGERAVEYARIMLKDAEAFTEQIRVYASRLSKVSIGSCSPAPMWDLAAKLGLLFSEYTMTMEIKDEASLKDGLIEGRYQVIIMKTPPKERGFLSSELIEERLAAEVPSSHPIAQNSSTTFDELKQYPVLVLSEPTVWRDLLQKNGVHLIFQEDPAILNDLKRSSNLISMSSDLARRWIEPPQNRVIIPISDPSASSFFYACVLEKNARFLEAVHP